jgi:hypothetical protein
LNWVALALAPANSELATTAAATIDFETTFIELSLIVMD